MQTASKLPWDIPKLAGASGAFGAENQEARSRTGSDMPRVSMTDQFLLSQQQQHQGAGLEGTMMEWPAAAGQSSGSGTVGIGGADEFDVPPGVGLGVGSAIKHGKNKMQLRINAHIDTSDLANTDYSQNNSVSLTQMC